MIFFRLTSLVVDTDGKWPLTDKMLVKRWIHCRERRPDAMPKTE
ncbi:hypothetical protein KP509_11G053100 [Ceratopteris richardii]|uniref:Uncharacterized protein n=1 Tax=Ceratopteris richardii TaxID=49495 RepID=A0A8T2TY72_CERRI|nr:hypothetical protein KP509_11G053100 [Ceratopteris richardii]